MLVAWLGVLGSLLPGCSDVGDSSAIPGCGGGDGSGPGPGIDANQGTDVTNPQPVADSSLPDSVVDAGQDATHPDAADAPGDTTINVVNDTGVGVVNDSTVGATNDTGSNVGNETGAANDATNDGVSDVGVGDTGGHVETDAGADSPVEAGADALTDAAAGDGESDATDSGVVHVVDAGNIQNECNAFVQANNTPDGGGAFEVDSGPFLAADHGVCTTTELTLFGKDPTGSCLACAFDKGCLDDTAGDSNNECEDVPSGAVANFTQLCLATLECDVGEQANGTFGPAPGAILVQNAYCGAGVTSSDCTATPTSPAGACAAQMNAGFPTLTPAQILGSLGNPMYPAGVANKVQACLNANCTGTGCFP